MQIMNVISCMKSRRIYKSGNFHKELEILAIIRKIVRNLHSKQHFRRSSQTGNLTEAFMTNAYFMESANQTISWNLLIGQFHRDNFISI